MSATMPVWIAVTLTVAVALITQIGGLTIQLLQQRHSRNTKRIEEWHRNLRWAVDLISNGNLDLGVHALDVLDDAKFLGEEDQALIDAILSKSIDSLDSLFDLEEDNIPPRGYTGGNEGTGGDSK